MTEPAQTPQVQHHVVHIVDDRWPWASRLPHTTPGHGRREEPAPKPQPNPEATVTDEMLAEATRYTELLLNLLDDPEPGLKLSEAIRDASWLAHLRSGHPVIRTLLLAYRAAEKADYADSEVRWARRLRAGAAASVALTAAGAGAIGRVNMPALAAHPELVPLVVQQAHKGEYGSTLAMPLLRRDLYRTCGKPADFDEHVDAILALFGSDEEGLRDWGHVCMVHPNYGPILTVAQVLSFAADPLTAMRDVVDGLPKRGNAVAPPRRSFQAMTAFRLTPGQVRAADGALRSGEHSPQTDMLLTVVGFQAARRGNLDIAGRIDGHFQARPGHCPWSAMLIDALSHCDRSSYDGLMALRRERHRTNK